MEFGSLDKDQLLNDLVHGDEWGHLAHPSSWQLCRGLRFLWSLSAEKIASC